MLGDLGADDLDPLARRRHGEQPIPILTGLGILFGKLAALCGNTVNAHVDDFFVVIQKLMEQRVPAGEPSIRVGLGFLGEIPSRHNHSNFQWRFVERRMPK